MIENDVVRCFDFGHSPKQTVPVGSFLRLKHDTKLTKRGQRQASAAYSVEGTGRSVEYYIYIVWFLSYAILPVYF